MHRHIDRQTAAAEPAHPWAAALAEAALDDRDGDAAMVAGQLCACGADPLALAARHVPDALRQIDAAAARGRVSGFEAAAARAALRLLALDLSRRATPAAVACPRRAAAISEAVGLS